MPSHFAHFSHPSSQQLHLNSLYKFQIPVIFFFFIFSPSPPSAISFSISWPVISLILLLFPPCPMLPCWLHSLPLPLPPRSFPHSLQCRTKWRLMKGGRCVCHPDSLMQPPQQVKYWIYSKHTRHSSNTAPAEKNDRLACRFYLDNL